VHGGTGGNVLVLVTSEGLVLVDGKYEDQYDALIKVIREKISTKPIKYVINTHFHSDHSGGNARLLPAGATVISSIRGRDNIINKVQPGAPVSMTPANVTFEGQMRLFVGGQEVRLTQWGPSHTGTDVTVYFPRDRVAATGDLMTNFKLPPGVVLPPGPLDYNGGGSLAGWIATLDALIATEGYDKVVPGHGSISTKADIATYRKKLAEMRDHVTALLRDGTRSEADLREQLKTEGWPELFIARAGHGLYLELKP
jgi:glyoxylase-like metal-dependent hydrolase (beta-lactamase superfamily II)